MDEVTLSRLETPEPRVKSVDKGVSSFLVVVVNIRVLDGQIVGVV